MSSNVNHILTVLQNIASLITPRNAYGPVVEGESKVTDNQPKLPENKKLGRANQNHLSKSNDNFPKPLPIISTKRSAKSELKKTIDEKRLKLDETAQSSNAVVNDALVEPRSPNRKLSVIIQDNQSVECSQAEESSAASNADESTDSRTKTLRVEQTEQDLNSPVKYVDKRTLVICDEDHSQRVKKPDQNNSMSQANSSSNTTEVSITAAQPSTAIEQSTQPHQYTYQEHIPDGSSLSNFQPKIVNIRSLANVDDHKVRVNEVSSHKPSTSHEGLDSLKNNGGRCVVPIQKSVEKRCTSHETNESTRSMNIKRNWAVATKNPSNSIDQTRYLSTSSVEQPPVVTQNQTQNDPQGLRTHTGSSRAQTTPFKINGMIFQEIHGPRINFERSNVLPAIDARNFLQGVNNVAATSQQLQSVSYNPPSHIRRSNGHQNSVAHEQYFTHSYQNQSLPTKQDNFQRKQLRSATESNTYDHRATSQTTNMKIPSIRQNSRHLLNPMYQTPELTQQRQMQTNQRDSQQQPQRPKIGIHKFTKPKNQKQMPILQGVTKKAVPSFRKSLQNSKQKALSTTNNNFVSNNPQLQITKSSQSTRDNIVDLTTSPQNIIASETCDRQNTEMPSHSVYQSSRIQHKTTHENECQNLCTQEQLVGQSTAKSPATGGHLNVMDKACQTDEDTVEETLSSYHVVTSDSDAVTDNEEVPDREMSTEESPVGTTNNVYVNINDSGCSSADKSTAAQSSSSTNHQTDPKVILEQQMLESFVILFTQMLSSMRNTADMNNTLRDSMPDAVETYKKLLDAVEEFKSAQRLAGNASFPINVTPEVQLSLKKN